MTKEQEIKKVCEKLGIEFTKTMIRRKTQEIEDIVQKCRDLGIEITATVYRRTATEIEEIYNIFNGYVPYHTIFYQPPKEVISILNKCSELNIELRANVFLRTAYEIESIYNLFNGNIPSYKVFNQKPEKIKTIIKLFSGKEPPKSQYGKKEANLEELIKKCNELNLPLENSMLIRTAKELEQIYNMFGGNIPFSGVFLKSPKEIKSILNVCDKYNVPITPSLFSVKANNLERNLQFLSEAVDAEIFNKFKVVPSIITQSSKKLYQTINYLNYLGFINLAADKPSIITLTAKDIFNRLMFLEEIGQSSVDVKEYKRNGKKKIELNPIFYKNGKQLKHYLKTIGCKKDTDYSFKDILKAGTMARRAEVEEGWRSYHSPEYLEK